MGWGALPVVIGPIGGCGRGDVCRGWGIWVSGMGLSAGVGCVGGSCMWGYGVLNWCRVVVGVSDMGIGGFERGLIKNTQLSRIKWYSTNLFKVTFCQNKLLTRINCNTIYMYLWWPFVNMSNYFKLSDAIWVYL